MKRVLSICAFILIIVILYLMYATYTYRQKKYEYAIPINIKSSINNDTIKITFDIENFEKIKNKNIYCLFSKESISPTLDNIGWFKSSNNSCEYIIDDNIYYGFLKNENNEIFNVDEVSSLGNIISVNINKDKIYLAKNDSYKLETTIKSVGKIDSTIKWESENDKVATVSSMGKVKGIKNGTTKIKAIIGDKEVTSNVTVTNLIVKRPQKFNSNKEYLPCGIYSKKDNDLLDEILEDRINEAGYKTRAGVVEAARFITLELPYKIRYFSENGRLTTNGVDGEGRYYYKGLYLHESRYSNITKSANGPKTWGCYMYSGPSHGQRPNGFDCSGYISWVLYNGGFDVKDVGAGVSVGLDLTDYGVRTKFNADLIKSGKVKVGDLLSSGGVEGGHIAMIVGEDKDNYYVTESLWTPPNVAVGIYTYSKKNIFDRYYYVMLMDSYYKKDGNLTKLWY